MGLGCAWIGVVTLFQEVSAFAVWATGCGGQTAFASLAAFSSFYSCLVRGCDCFIGGQSMNCLWNMPTLDLCFYLLPQGISLVFFFLLLLLGFETDFPSAEMRYCVWLNFPGFSDDHTCRHWRSFMRVTNGSENFSKGGSFFKSHLKLKGDGVGLFLELHSRRGQRSQSPVNLLVYAVTTDLLI